MRVVKMELIKMIELIKSNNGMRANELAKIMEKGVSTIERYIKLLRTEGYIEFRGAPKTGGY